MKSTPVPRETPAQADPIGVVLPKDKAQGIKAIGAMKPGEIYQVAPAEALRLVTAKRFEYATDEDRKRAIAYEASLAARTNAPAAAADTATTED